MRPMLEAGRVFAAQPPLFTAKVGDKIHRAFSDADRDRITKELSKGNRRAENIRWQRFKGLGEMNVQELAECALDPAPGSCGASPWPMRRPPQKAAETMFEILMGNDVASRKDYLVKNSALFDRAALDI